MKKRYAALLLSILCLALLLTACSKPDPTGSWTAEIRYADYAEQLDALSPGLSSTLDLSDLKLELRLDLAGDGAFNLYTEQASLDRLMTDLRGPIEKAARQSMQETYGLTQAQLDDRLTELGLSLDEMVGDFLSELKGVEKPARITGTWRWEEGRLILTGKDGTEAAYEAELAGESLTVRAAAEDDGLGFGGLLPLTFRK